MSSLYELTAEHRYMLSLLSDPDADEQAVLDTLEGIEGEIEVKAEGYVKVLRHLEADSKAYMEEADRLAKKAEVTNNRIKRLKDALAMAMIATGHDDKEGIKAGLFRIKLVGNGGVRPLIIDGNVPDKYVKMVPQNDSKAIREHLEELEKAGLECAWAHLEERGKHISIK